MQEKSTQSRVAIPRKSVRSDDSPRCAIWATWVKRTNDFLGNVTFSRVFPNSLLEGTRTLRAVGSTTLRRSIFVDSDIAWTLCP